MLTTTTLGQLRELGLAGMHRALSEQMESAHARELPFDDRLGMLLDRELQDRYNRKLQRNLKAAKLRVDACMEDLDFRRPRGLDRAAVLALASAQWVAARQNVLVVGPTGAGKTFLACALAHAAVRAGHTALYLRAPRLLDDLTVARGDGRLPRILAAWARVDVLVIDDLALRPLSPAAAADLLEVIEDRAGRRSTVVASQLPIHDWHAALGDPSLADAILDRLAHNAHRLTLSGESMRRQKANDGTDTTERVSPAGKRAAQTAVEGR
jgi:DNA replication protein DnaC